MEFASSLDINECEVGSHRCHTQATCCNSPGSFDCFCNVGYSGDGQNCTGKLDI